MTTTIKTILDLDLVGYSSIAHAVEDTLETKHVLDLNDQIQSFVDRALETVNLIRADVVLATTGDGAILGFDKASQAYNFAVALHDLSREWNFRKTEAIALRVFRVGIATGPIEIREQNGMYDFAGFAIARAVRLEANANAGHVLVDSETYKGLSAHVRKAFDGPRRVAGKRNEVFDAYSCPCYLPDAKLMARLLPLVHPFDKVRGAQSNREIRLEILRLLQSLRPHQYEELIFLLMIPIDRRPPRSVPVVERRAMILEWAAEEINGVADLCESLKLITEHKTQSSNDSQ